MLHMQIFWAVHLKYPQMKQCVISISPADLIPFPWDAYDLAAWEYA